MKKFFISTLFISFFFIFNANAAKNLYLSYLDVPKKVYKNQRFEIKLKAIITTKEFEDINTTFFKSKNLSVLNPDSPWIEIDNEVYENSFYFKAKENFVLPEFTVQLLSQSDIIEESTLESKKIPIFDIASGDKRFSGLIAQELHLKAYKTKQYNNKESLTIIDLEAVNSNLENFVLQNIKEQGLSSLKDEYPNQNLIYYFVMPVHKKKVVFSYYNTSKQMLETITIPLILQNELVSTQTDLNPNNSNFEKYKKAAVLAVFILFLFLFIWKRKKFYLFFALVFLLLSVIYLMPNKTALVKKDSFIYILPTKNSTIFFKLDKDAKVEVLNSKNGFKKVMGKKNKFIGWVKEENFGKN